MTTLITLVLGAGLVALIAAAIREMTADQVVDRPGSDEQWRDLADAMRRFRKHKARERRRAH